MINIKYMDLMPTVALGETRLVPPETEYTESGTAEQERRWFHFFLQAASEISSVHLIAYVTKAVQVLSDVYHVSLEKKLARKHCAEGHLLEPRNKKNAWVTFAKNNYANFCFVLHYARALATRYFLVNKDYHGCHDMLAWMKANPPMPVDLLGDLTAVPNCTQFKTVKGLGFWHYYRAQHVLEYLHNPKRFTWNESSLIDPPKWWSYYYDYLKKRTPCVVPGQEFVDVTLDAKHFRNVDRLLRKAYLKRRRERTGYRQRKRKNTTVKA